MDSTRKSRFRICSPNFFSRLDVRCISWILQECSFLLGVCRCLKVKLIGMVIGTQARIFTEICTSDQCVGPLIGGGRSWRREREGRQMKLSSSSERALTHLARPRHPAQRHPGSHWETCTGNNRRLSPLSSVSVVMAVGRV